MKKLFGLLAFMTVISGVAVADEFTNLNLDSHWRGIHGGLDNRTNLNLNERRNEFTGTLSLDDEWKGLSFNFDFLRKDYYNTNSHWIGGGWDNDVFLAKDFSHGAFVGDFKLGWKYEGYTSDEFGSQGHGNEYYFGPTVGFKLLGQEGTFTAQFVYYNDVDGDTNRLGHTAIEEKTYGRDYKDAGTEGIGGNFDFNFNGTIAQGRFGTVTYNLDLKNHWRDATNTKSTDSDGRNSVYLDYDGVVSYDSPRFYGFGVGVDMENEYEMQTGNGNYVNGFYLSPKASFKHTFDTSIGKVGVMPYVKWDAIDQQKGKTDGKDYSGYGDTKLRAGLNLSLDRGE